MIEDRAQTLGEGTFRLDTKNVAAVEMSPPADLGGAGDGVLNVIWNGRK